MLNTCAATPRSLETRLHAGPVPCHPPLFCSSHSSLFQVLPPHRGTFPVLQPCLAHSFGLSCSWPDASPQELSPSSPPANHGQLDRSPFPSSATATLSTRKANATSLPPPLDCVPLPGIQNYTRHITGTHKLFGEQMEYTNDQKQPRADTRGHSGTRRQGQKVGSASHPHPFRLALGKEGTGQGQGSMSIGGGERPPHPSPKQASNGANSVISGTTEAYFVPALPRRKESKTITQNDRNNPRNSDHDTGKRQKRVSLTPAR